MAVLFINSIVLVILPSSLVAQDDAVTVGGAYLGLFNYFDQENSGIGEPERNQFDVAANIDFEWKIRSNIKGLFQLQGSPGGGSFGYPGPEVEITDLNIEFSFADQDATLVAGSFDSPFGMQTGSLSNNADTFGNPLLMNSLFYSAFAGAPMGTLNTIGVMGNYMHENFDLSLAVTNGTDESANNSDGGFEVSGTAMGIIPVAQGEVRVAGSYINSDDRSESGATGTSSDFSGWMSEALYAPASDIYIKGYFGSLTYNDNLDTTEDDVIIWMGEVRYGQDRWHLGARISGWMPQDEDADGSGISGLIPNPGLALQVAGTMPVIDQKITRIQVGAGYGLDDDLMIKIEIFMDNYDKASLTESTDVQGVIIALNGTI
ncbi:MAG: hypothetical protein GF404_11155 [candidate division Zixibacteria bacterium]|nr:hypothetical protein [candidate division Zixibacteria bacterium]